MTITEERPAARPAGAPAPPSPGTLGAAAGLGLLGVALLDAVHLARSRPPPATAAGPTAVLLLLLPGLGILLGSSAGHALGALGRLASRLPLRLSPPAGLAVLCAALAAVPLALFAHSVFSGPRASRMAGRTALEAGLFLVLLGLLALGVRVLPALAARPRARRVAALALLPIVLLLHWADGNLHTRTYPQIHALLALAVSALAAVSATLLGPPRPLGRARLPLALLLLAGAGTALASSDRVRWVVRDRAPVAGKVVQALDPVFRRAGRSPGAEDLPAILPPPDDGASARRSRLDRLLPGRRRWGVLLVTLDAVRPDKLGLYGDPRRATPHLDALAERSVHFPETRAQYPGTRFSVASMLRSRYPLSTPEFAATFRTGPATEDAPTLPERLRDAGFTTSLFLALAQGDLGDPGLYRFFQDGVDHVVSTYDGNVNGTSRRVVEAALAHLGGSGAGRRPFAWLFLGDAHHPYRCGPRFGTSDEECYLSEVAGVDEALGSLLGGLERAGLLDRLVVVVHADHGEEFGEHGGRYHLTTAYEEQVRVPLLFRVPGLRPGAAPAPAALVDVAPTVLELLDLPRDPKAHGYSLVPQLLDHGAPLDRPVFSQVDPYSTTASRLRAVARRGWKMIADVEAGTRELYDLRRDPRERENRAGAGDPEEAELGLLLSAYMDLSRGTQAVPLPRQAPEEAEARAGAVRSLLALLADPEPGPRAFSALLLAFERSPDPVPALAAAAGDPDPAVRAAVAFALAAHGEPADGRALLPLLKGPHPLAVLLARLGLALLGHEEFRWAFAEASTSGQASLTRIVLDFLERDLRPEDFPSLLEIVQDEDQHAEHRVRAVRLVSQIDRPGALRALARIERLGHRWLAEPARAALEERAGAAPPGAPAIEAVRAAAALEERALAGRWQEDEAVTTSLLLSSLDHDPGDAEVRLHVARSLWNHGHVEEALRQADRMAAIPGALRPRPGAGAVVAGALRRLLAAPDGGRARPVLAALRLERVVPAGEAVILPLLVRNSGEDPLLGPYWRGGVLLRCGAEGPGGEGQMEPLEIRRAQDLLLSGEAVRVLTACRLPREPGVYSLRIEAGIGERVTDTLRIEPLFVVRPDGREREDSLRDQALRWTAETPPSHLFAGEEAVLSLRLSYRGSLRLPGGDAPGSLSLTPRFRGEVAPAGPPVRFPLPVVEPGAIAEARLTLRAPRAPGDYELDLVPSLEGHGSFEPVHWAQVEVRP